MIGDVLIHSVYFPMETQQIKAILRTCCQLRHSSSVLSPVLVAIL